MSTVLNFKAPAVATTGSDLFFATLADAKQRVLFVDYDGTLAPFSADRNRAFPYPAVPSLLNSIMSNCNTRLVLISGRAAREIPPLLGVFPQPEIWGTHGIERLYPNGNYEQAKMADEVLHALMAADSDLRNAGLEELAEMKPGAIAVHWRGLDLRHLEEIRTSAYRVLSPLAFRYGLLLAEFDSGLELRARNRSKGDAVRTVLAEVGDAPVAYLGDDITDEDAFRALHGRGLTVLVRPTYRFTAAQIWLRPPDELVQFFLDWIRACGGEN